MPEYDKVNVGRRFQALRKLRGMSQTDWALAIGLKCSPQKIWNYERGQDQLPIEYAARACILTGANFDYLYRGMASAIDGSLRAEIMRQEADLLAAKRDYRRG